MIIQTDVLFDDFGFEMNALALDMEDLESPEDNESTEELESVYDLDSMEEMESTEALDSSDNIEYAESTYEVTGEMTVVNFDKFDTPLVDCSAITINLLLVLMFVALATVGGVLNE